MNQNPLPDATLEERLAYIRARVAEAAAESGRRPEDVTLLAATKMQDAQTINRAIAAGITHIGENRVQELTAKYEDYDKDRCSIHFIGHLQQNKVKYIADKVDMIQSVDSLPLAMEIEKQCAKLGRVMDVLVEVNVGQEAAKSGVYPEKLQNFLTELAPFAHLHVRGLMSIPPVCQNPADSRHYFGILHQEFLDIMEKKIDNVHMDYLSMGMSADFYDAICCGANLVRVGTALFGARNY